MNIPRFLQLYKEDRLEDAFEAVIMDNPLPSSTGRVCQHPCDSRCRRQTIDEAVNMREVHRFIADSILLSNRYEHMVKRIVVRRLEHTGRKIAIAGAGPAGLTAAFYLALLGHDVTVYDAKPAAGGMLRFALPEYRLPKTALEREIDLIERLGVKFIFNTRIGFDIPLNDLDDRFDAVFISIGTWKESWVYLPGTELKGVSNLIVATGHNNLAIGRSVQQVSERFIDGNKLQEGMLNRVSAVVRAYDPCLSCSTHALGEIALRIQLVDANGQLRDEVATR
ncbi:MAG: NAD(P)-binding protein [Candidatus Sulfotelmatobacter sp.]|jgi:NADPH-dependent glutamate synthase beta subunit-like oxidoreductase